MRASRMIAGLAAAAASAGLGLAGPANAQPYGYGFSGYGRSYVYPGGYGWRSAAYGREGLRNAVNSCGYQAGEYGPGSRITGAERVGRDWYRVDGVIVAGKRSRGNVVYDDRGNSDDRDKDADLTGHSARSAGYDDGVGFDSVAEARSRSGYRSDDPPERYYSHSDRLAPGFHYETPAYVRYEAGFTCLARADGRISEFGFDR